MARPVTDYYLLGSAKGSVIGGTLLLLSTFSADNNDEYTFCIAFGGLFLLVGVWIWWKMAKFHWTFHD